MQLRGQEHVGDFFGTSQALKVFGISESTESVLPRANIKWQHISGTGAALVVPQGLGCSPKVQCPEPVDTVQDQVIQLRHACVQLNPSVTARSPISEGFKVLLPKTDHISRSVPMVKRLLWHVVSPAC